MFFHFGNETRAVFGSVFKFDQSQNQKKIKLFSNIFKVLNFYFLVKIKIWPKDGAVWPKKILSD